MQVDPLAVRQRARLLEVSQAYGLQAFLVAFAGLGVVFSQAIEPEAWLPAAIPAEVWLGLVLGSSALIAVGGWSLLRYPSFGRRVVLLGLVAYCVTVGPRLAASPARVLVLLLVAAAIGLRLRTYAVEAELRVPTDPSSIGHPRLFGGAVEASSLVSLAAFLLVGTRLATGPIAIGAAIGVFAVSFVYKAIWARRTWVRETARQRWSLAALPVFPVLAALSWQAPLVAVAWLAMFELASLVLQRVRRQSPGAMWSGVLDHPARLLATTFAAIAVAGGIVLSLPMCTTRPIPLIDAFFTSFSATCVTGLITLDTPNDFSFLGQVVILVLFQVGGLGIMTFSTAGVLLLGHRLGLRHEIAVGGLLTHEGGGDLYGASRRILATTFGLESVGAGVLSLLFAWDGDPWPMAIWRGVFTSVSAFCNAGFALQSDSLIPYQQDSLVLFTVMGLIIAGGLGAPVLHALPLFYRRRPVSLQARLVLATTLALIVLPFPLVAALEWDHTLAGLPVWDKLVNAMFQTVTPRTAGFNSIDFVQLRPASVTLQLGLMFVGGSPFSTAGGVKTTTIALIGLGVLALMWGKPEPTAFGRRISHESIYKSLAIVTIATGFVGAGFVALQVTQPMPYEMGLFEIVSALGTVGTSIGGTAQLDGVGKIIVMICMFAGRVGPVTLFLLFHERRRTPRWVYPEEKVAVG